MFNLMSYNLEFKLAGNCASVKKYNRTKIFNYQDKKGKNVGVAKGKSNKALENFIRSTMRARRKIFDIVACNINMLDYYGNIQRPKFWTLTFADNIQDIKEANKEFTDFNKRLSYHFYKINKNVLKYVCIPEFQKRGAVHYHVLYFNLPYIEQSVLLNIWKQGFVFVESIKNTSEIENFAKYVCKYISKNNSKGESNYHLYKEKGLLNSKRYFCSRGLKKPAVYKLNVDEKMYNECLALLKEFHKDNIEYHNEYIGDIEINTYEVEEKIKKVLMAFVNIAFKRMKNMYWNDDWKLLKSLFNWKLLKGKDALTIDRELMELGWC